MSDAEKIAEVLAAHQWMGSGGDARSFQQRCTCGYEVPGVGSGQRHHALLAHQAAALEPVIREREQAAWDACAREADRKWLIGTASAHKLMRNNPYDTKEEA